MTTVDKQLQHAAELAGKKLGLSPRFLAAWWISENGYEWPETNNIGNISFQGSGTPSGGVFEGVSHVLDNRVCVYKDEESGVNAFCHLLETPKSEKALTLDLAELKACGGDIHKACQLVGLSNWASSHYDRNGEGPGSLIWDVYKGSTLNHVWPEEGVPAAPIKEASPTKTTHESHAPTRRQSIVIRRGDTLSRLALDHRTTVRALEVLNSIADPNKIIAGESIKLPLVYQVKPGDTVTKIAKVYGTTVDKVAHMNRINPNYIQVGWHLFV